MALWFHPLSISKPGLLQRPNANHKGVMFLLSDPAVTNTEYDTLTADSFCHVAGTTWLNVSETLCHSK